MPVVWRRRECRRLTPGRMAGGSFARPKPSIALGMHERKGRTDAAPSILVRVAREANSYVVKFAAAIVPVTPVMSIRRSNVSVNS